MWGLSRERKLAGPLNHLCRMADGMRNAQEGFFEPRISRMTRIEISLAHRGYELGTKLPKIAFRMISLKRDFAPSAAGR